MVYLINPSREFLQTETEGHPFSEGEQSRLGTSRGGFIIGVLVETPQKAYRSWTAFSALGWPPHFKMWTRGKGVWRPNHTKEMSIQEKLCTVIVLQISHAISIHRATRQGWSPRHPCLNSVFPQSAEHRGYCPGNALVPSVWGLLWGQASEFVYVLMLWQLDGVGCRVGKRWEQSLESLTAMLNADRHVFVAK